MIDTDAGTTTPPAQHERSASGPRWPGRFALLVACAAACLVVFVVTVRPSDMPVIILYIPLAILGWIASALVSTVVFSLNRRSLPARIAFGMHVLSVVWLAVLWHSNSRQSAARAREAQREAQIQSERDLQTQRQTAELARLIESYQYPAAIGYLRAHPALLVGVGPVLRHTLCPPDNRGPDLALLRALTQRGAPSDAELLLEASKCSLTSFRKVMQLGLPADVHTDAGSNALSTARSPALLAFLLAAGLDVNAPDQRGVRPLMLHRNAEVTRFLLDHGADPTARDDQRRSALHFPGPPDQLAAIFEQLLASGADVNLEAAYGRTPLQELAISPQGWSQAAADLLVAHGARKTDRLWAIEKLLVARTAQGPVSVEACLHWPELDLAGSGGSLLVAALYTGRTDAVEQLLARGANPHTRHEGYSQTALSYFPAVEATTGEIDRELQRKVQAAAARFTSDANQQPR